MYSLDQHLPHKNLVLITGATGGLGKAFAVECASRGWDLFLTDLYADRLEILAAGLRNGYRVNVWVHACDLTDPAERASMFEKIHSGSLRFWGLINVAGIDYEGPFFEQTGQQICTILRLNIEGTLEMTHAILAYRNPLTPFRIINVSSLAAFYPMPVKATYAASKRFILDFSLALREEVRGLGATVTVLCPAGLPTTPECIRAIEAQGWMGQITTQNVGRVAYQTIHAALAGRPVVIPGLTNRFLQFLGNLLPSRLLVSLIGSRWKSAQQKRKLPREFVTA
jgi:uncharacterized protein